MEYTYVLLVAMFGVTHHQNTPVLSDALIQGTNNCFKWFDEDRNRFLDMREFFNVLLGQNPISNSSLDVLTKRLTKCNVEVGMLSPKLFAMVNTNSDHHVDLVEARNVMTKFDANRDKKVSRDEFVRYIQVYLMKS